jgi:hypothetical protein
MGILWASGKISREEILATARKAKPYAKFRDKFQQNNVTGQASAAAAGTKPLREVQSHRKRGRRIDDPFPGRTGS